VKAKKSVEDAKRVEKEQDNKNRKKGLRIKTTDLHRKQHGPLDMFYVSKNDLISAALHSALDTARIIDDVDNIICPGEMKTPKAADPNLNADYNQLR
jgi:hypothetical protein